MSGVEWCQTCYLGFTLLQNLTCTNQCGDLSQYYAADTGVCKPCIVPCLQCSSTSSCSLCLKGYFLTEGTCLAVCPFSQGFYNLTDNLGYHFCIPCSAENCNYCPEDTC